MKTNLEAIQFNTLDKHFLFIFRSLEKRMAREVTTAALIG